MVKTIFHLTHEKWKVLFKTTVIYLQPAFRKSPKVFDSINVDLALTKTLTVRNTSMLKPLQVQMIVGPEAIRINPGLWPHMTLDRTLQGYPIHLFGEHHPDVSITLEKPKYRDFTACTASSFPFSCATKIRFIHFNLARQFTQNSFRIFCNPFPESGEISLHRFSINPKIICNPFSRYHQPEQSNDLFQHRGTELLHAPYWCISLATTCALFTSISKRIVLAMTTNRAANMLSMACHQMRYQMVTYLSSIRPLVFPHRTNLSWSDLMV